jgi:hypothetical protein
MVGGHGAVFKAAQATKGSGQLQGRGPEHRPGLGARIDCSRIHRRPRAEQATRLSELLSRLILVGCIFGVILLHRLRRGGCRGERDHKPDHNQ